MRTFRVWVSLLGQSGFIWLPVVVAVGVAAGLAWLFAWRRPPAPRPPTSGAAA